VLYFNNIDNRVLTPGDLHGQGLTNRICMELVFPRKRSAPIQIGGRQDRQRKRERPKNLTGHRFIETLSVQIGSEPMLGHFILAHFLHANRSPFRSETSWMVRAQKRPQSEALRPSVPNSGNAYCSPSAAEDEGDGNAQLGAAATGASVDGSSGAGN
jgi:hypothetical protein